MSVLAALEKAGSTPSRVWRRVFLRSLAQHGNLSRACRDAGVHPRHVRRLRRQNARFDRKCLDALREADRRIVDAAESALYDRGIDGVEQPIIKDGRVVGTATKYSDKCLEMLLKARRPKRYDRNRQGGNVSITVNRQDVQVSMLANPRMVELACQMAEERARMLSGPPQGVTSDIEV
jgi:hypothetical protein